MQNVRNAKLTIEDFAFGTFCIDLFTIQSGRLWTEGGRGCGRGVSSKWTKLHKGEGGWGFFFKKKIVFLVGRWSDE